MENDLLAYLLDGLDVTESRRVESALETSPDLRAKLVRLRVLLRPLEADAEHPQPPDDLYVRTLRLVAHVKTQRSVPVTAPAVPRGEARPTRRWWRRADVLVAAGIVFVAGMLLPNLLLHLRRQEGIVACADNMRLHHQAISQWEDVHNGYFPKAHEVTPVNLAGAAEVMLRDGGYWKEGMRINCPGRGDPNGRVPMSLSDAQRRAAQAGDDSWQRELSGCYATPLGYWKDGPGGRIWEQIDRSLGGTIPVMADRPPRPNEVPGWETANSPNHGGLGQNVLYQGGNVRFQNLRSGPVGAGWDNDLFRNETGRLEPSVRPQDAVLAPSETRIPASKQAIPPNHE